MIEIYCQVNETPQMNKPEWIPENPYVDDKWDIARKQEFVYWAACQAQFKSLIEWLEQPCVEHHPGAVPPRRLCIECWQELRLSL